MILRELQNRTCTGATVEPAFLHTFDIVIAGLGTAGAPAALAAAESGAKVCVVEKLNLPGGSATSGGIAGYYFGLPGGLFEKIDSAAEQLRTLSFIQGGDFHPDAKGMAVERALMERGVEIFYESTPCAVFLDDDGRRVRGVRVATPSGVADIACGMLIDATGNGDVCALAGAAFTEGRASDGQAQPFSSVRVYRRDNSFHGANFDAGVTTSTDAAELNRAIINSNALHCWPPGSGAMRLYYITQLPGHRESRLVCCDHTLTAGEIISGDWQHQPLAHAYSNFDSHSADWAFEDDTACDWMIAASLWGKNMVAPITLESMTARGFANLLVVGRAVSVDHLAASLVRMQRCLQKNGEVAGRAAALALAAGKSDVREVDRAELEKQLRASGCLDESILPGCTFPAANWVEELGSGKPGEAMWYASRHLDATRGKLVELLADEAPHTAVNSAIALAMGGDASGLALLRRHLVARDEFLPRSSRHSNYPRLYALAYLLGRVGEPSDAGLLLDLAKERLSDFHVFSHAWRGLLQLGNRFPPLREKIARELCAILEQEDFELPLLIRNPLMPSQTFRQPMHNLVRVLSALEFKRWGVPSRLKECLEKQNLTWRERNLFGRFSHAVKPRPSAVGRDGAHR